MQISRHWRMNSQRYRLQGVRLENGQVSLSARQPRSEEQTQSIQRPVQHNANSTVNAA